jgi:hypothetical protein
MSGESDPTNLFSGQAGFGQAVVVKFESAE